MFFDTVEQLYVERVRNSHILSRKKLQRLTLNLPLENDAVPNELKYTKYWTGVSEKYANQINQQGIKKEIEKSKND